MGCNIKWGRVREAAARVSEYAIISYWLNAYEQESRSHEEWAHESFRDLARQLGYEVKRKDRKIEKPPAPESLLPEGETA